MSRSARLQLMRCFITTEEIETQEELLKLLSQQGYQVTQATLSRDLKQLSVAKKINASSKWVYVFDANPIVKREVKSSPSVPPHLVSGFVSIAFSGNLAVVKTLPGVASGIALEIDNQSLESIMGTIAGDDTILLILSENHPVEEVKNRLRTLFPSIN